MEGQNLIESSSTYLGMAFQTVSNQVVSILPKIFLAIIIFIAGWIVAAAIAEIVVRILKSLKIEILRN